MKHGIAIALASLWIGSGASAAQFSVGAGSSVDLGTGSLDLGCADLSVDGTLSAGSVGLDAARDVTIAPAGVVNGDSATITVAGDWDNTGTFNAGTSTVQLVDGCALSSAVIAGSSTFNNLQLLTSTGFLYSFVSGTTQTVSGTLDIMGADANLLTIRSTLGGSAAFLNSQGNSNASFVDVMDNDATPGNFIFIGQDSIKGSNTDGWVQSLAVPTLGVSGLLLLALTLLWAGRQLASPTRR